MDATNETPEERRRRKARERKARQREREKRLGMKAVRLDLSQGERATIERMAEARGFEDQTEYLYALVRADEQALARDPAFNPALEVVTGHAAASAV
ncbi:hypothetical protein [Alkalilimnicola sp. S0819]|uniref:hypothetical protein n=1 Tax=Alkalilimnicola sp. S0819 TaxID=2613922 RepID=UPI0012619B1B|nr:hypothetical protein [Alkalilimnicola sp. S0819]KAB7624345.1 hypothetical protein F3N43_05935 [Alkalilimnicola sp. S0819]MPQ16171.1 hypothetical protein [Alkalilimnicola sp. S0819]